MRTPFITLAALAATAVVSAIAAPVTAAAQPAINPDCGIPGVASPLPCPSGDNDLPDAHVCFYIKTDFSDRHFCEAGSRTVNVIRDAWKHHVKSIEIATNSSVRICSEPDLKGTCALLDSNQRTLIPEIFDHLYSYRTDKVRD
jgi:Peptidase inhibitor family I36